MSDYAIITPYKSKKIVLSCQAEQNADEAAMNEIWSLDQDAFPMNRSLRLDLSQVRKIRSQWQEFLYGDKSFSCITFFDKDDRVMGKMNSHPEQIVLPSSYVSKEVVVEESLKEGEQIVGIQYGVVVDDDEPVYQFDRFRFLIVNNF